MNDDTALWILLSDYIKEKGVRWIDGELSAGTRIMCFKSHV